MNNILKLVFSFVSLGVLLGAPTTDAVTKTGERVADYETKEELSRTEDEMRDIYSEFLSLLPPDISALGEGFSGTGGIVELLEVLAAPLSDSIDELSGTLLLCLFICILMCLCELLLADNGELYVTARGALSIILTFPVIGVMGQLLSSVIGGIREASGFFSEVLPLISSVIAIGVGGGTAAASAAGMSVTLGFVEGVICDNLYLIFTAVFALSVIGNLDTGQGGGGVARGFRSCYTFLLGAVSLILGGTLALGTALTASRDTLALRSAKYVISGMVPVVGGIVSGSIGALLSGARLLSGAIGALGVIAIVYYMAVPLISLLAFRLCLGVCIMFSGFTSSSLASKFFEALRGSIDCLIAPLAYSLIIYVLELALFSVTVGAVR